MAELRIALNNIAPEGKTFVMDDPAIWSVPMTECGYGLPHRPASCGHGYASSPGRRLPCTRQPEWRGRRSLYRCAEDAHLIIDSSFDSFEPFPQAVDEPEPRNGKEKPFDSEADELIVKLVDGAPRRSIWPACSGRVCARPSGTSSVQA